jgi:CDP-4-dehydro-6-deoxyglucose reductase, E3
MNTSKATLTKHTDLTYNVFELTFQTEDPAFEYQAGQFVTIKIPQPTNKPLIMRSYSISSKPTKGQFELCVKLMPEGKGSNYLNSLKPGEEIEFIGPVGHFTFKTDPDKRVLLIGTGTGLAPLKSILEEQLPNNPNQKFYLLFGVRHIKDLFYQDKLAALAAQHPNFTYTTTLSQPESPGWETQGGAQGRVTAHLEKIPPKDLQNTNAYICGLKDMVLQVQEMLQQKGLPKEAVYFERFN